MKLQACGFIVLILASAEIFTSQLGMTPYGNKVFAIEEFKGVRTYTLAFRCDQYKPIVTYAPKTFSESQDSGCHRYILPNTTLASDVQHQPLSVTQSGAHVEIVLQGRVVTYTVDDHTVLFRVH